MSDCWKVIPVLPYQKL